MRKRILPIVVVAAVIAAAVYFIVRRWNGANTNVIAISGNLELTEVKMSFKTAGRLAELNVKEGDVVRKGTVVARLDREQLSSQRDAQRAALAAAESQLEQLRTSIEFQRETYEGGLSASQADVAQAEARLRELQTGARPQEIQQARAAVEAARTEAARAAADWQRAQALHKDDDISTSQFDQFRTQFERASALLKQAEQQLALVEEGPRKETIEAARAQLQRAQASARLANTPGVELKRRQQEVAARQAEIARVRAQLALVESQLADTELVAPIDGVVLVKSAELGEVIAAGGAVVTLGDVEHPWLRGYVNETQLGRVKLNAKARVATDSYPGKTYWGRVSFIASEAEFTPKQIQTSEERVKLVYRIKIDLANPDGELKLNMPADAEILLAEAESR
jgi:HlyD family secretion protein